MENNAMLIRLNEKNNRLIRLKSLITTLEQNPIQNLAIKITIPLLTKIHRLKPKAKTLIPNKILLIILNLNKKVHKITKLINKPILIQIKTIQRFFTSLDKIQGNAY